MNYTEECLNFEGKVEKEKTTPGEKNALEVDHQGSFNYS